MNDHDEITSEMHIVQKKMLFVVVVKDYLIY